MKILVIGQGGREHALVRAFSHSPSVSEVHCIPGNDGMNLEAVCHKVDWRDFEAIVQFCIKNDISYVFIGPEEPLVAGLADYLRERGILAIGPNQEAAQLEGSKIFAKKFMQAAQVPTAFFEEVHSVEDVLRVSGRFTPPYVFKADGLAAGKGVFICATLDELKLAAIDVFDHQTLGLAGSKGLIEQFMPGWELSYLVITDGTNYQTLPLSQDHKRLLDNDLGPNTGGMGTVAPLKISEELELLIKSKILEPTFREIQKRNFIYRGVLYFGLMITDKGPQVLEFNCRFGDPETQVILPLLSQDVGELFHNVSKGKLPEVKIKNMFASCVILAAPGYPGITEKVEITGDVSTQSSSSYFIHAGTKQNSHSKTWQTNGGRVLCAIGLGSSLKESLQQAYTQASQVNWQGLIKRSDIGQKLLKS